MWGVFGTRAIGTLVGGFPPPPQGGVSRDCGVGPDVHGDQVDAVSTTPEGVSVGIVGGGTRPIDDPAEFPPPPRGVSVGIVGLLRGCGT